MKVEFHCFAHEIVGHCPRCKRGADKMAANYMGTEQLHFWDEIFKVEHDSGEVEYVCGKCALTLDPNAPVIIRGAAIKEEIQDDRNLRATATPRDW